jgi:hypothetical protein
MMGIQLRLQGRRQPVVVFHKHLERPGQIPIALVLQELPWAFFVRPEPHVAIEDEPGVRVRGDVMSVENISEP